MRRDRAGLALVAATLALCGCGSGPSKLLHSRSSSARKSGGAPAAAVKVIRGWADALRSGHVSAAAAYFRIPSVIYLGSGPPVQIRSRTAAQLANAALPCGAQLVSTQRFGRYVNALFRLTDRPGRGGAGGCGSGAGETARTNFLIEQGQIVEWLRAPDQPGDNGTPRSAPGPETAPPAVPTTPATPTSPGTIPGGGTPLA
jgi:hypothetical protein